MAYNEYLTYKEQVTYDGINWVDTGVVVPSGDPIGTYDTLEECELGTKVRIGYGTRYGYIDTYKSKACDGDNVLHRSEVKIPDNRFGALYIGDCVEIIESGLTLGFDYDGIDFYRIDGGTNVRTIGQDAFSGQTRLFVRGLNIKMPNLKRIERNAFKGISGQADDNYGASGFTLPDGLEYIGDYAFSGGGGSTQGGYFTIPASVTFIGDKALATNVNYNGYEFKGTVPPAINGNPFKDYFGGRVYVPADRSVIQAYLDAFTIFDEFWSPPIQPTPNGPVFRTLDCFVGIYPSPRGLGQFKYIWNSHFHEDRVLDASDVRCLDGNCNLQLAGLTEVIVGNECSTISADTFIGRTELSSVEIADTVTSIGVGAFAYCSGLTNVTINATTPPTLAGDVFWNTNDTFQIYVPSGSVNAYKTASVWNSYASRIQAIT